MDKLWRLNPNNALWLGTAGWGIAWSGQCERGRAMFNEATKLNPYHPGWLHYPFVICYYFKNNYEAALAELQKIDMPDMFWTPMLYAAIYAQKGNSEKARLSLGEAVRQNPDLVERPRFWIGAYVIPEEFIEKIVDGLRKAGLKAPATG
jgi:tetratricopeptide (TPR) repeat protein